MPADISAAWEGADLGLDQRAAFLVAWSRNELSPSGGLFRTGTGGFLTSGRIQPFLSHVLGRGDDASTVLNHILQRHPRDAPSVLVSIGRHANSAGADLDGVGWEGAPAHAKQMIGAMLRYSVSLGGLVQRCNRSVIDSLRAGVSICAVTESNADAALIRWLSDCVELATEEQPDTSFLAPTRELADLLVASIQVGRLDDTLRLPLAAPEPTPMLPLGEGSEWHSVATGDENDIESYLVSLAGMDDAWYEGDLHEKFSFMDDVLEHTSASVDSDIDEDQPPGRSFTVHEVHVQNEAAFKDEVRKRINDLAELRDRLANRKRNE